MDAHVRFIETSGVAATAAPVVPKLNKPPQALPLTQISQSQQSQQSQQAKQGPLTPKGFQRGQPYYKFIRPSFLEGEYKYTIGPNRINTTGLWFCAKRQLPIVGMKYKNIPGVLIVEVRIYESSNVIESAGIYKTDIMHISNPKPVLEFFRGVEVAVWEINPEFVLTYFPPLPNIRRFLIQKNPLNLLEFPSYTFEEAVEACRRDRDLIEDICPEYKMQVKLALIKRK